MPSMKCFMEEAIVTATLSGLDVFKLVFPPSQISVILRETNIALLQCNNTATPMTRQELNKLMGVLILLIRFESAARMRGVICGTTIHHLHTNSQQNLEGSFPKIDVMSQQHHFDLAINQL
jgi:hypothetical protein